MEKNSPPALEDIPQNDGRRDYVDDVPVAALPKSFASRIFPVFACGAGLFSDGYLQSV
jgi:hypothetical protein